MAFIYFTLVRGRRPYDRHFNPRLPVTPPPNFPEDLIEDIVSRVHPRELCIFKLVSKGFKNLISGKAFLLNNIQKMELLNRAVYIFQKEALYAPLCYNIEGAHKPRNGRVIVPDASEIKILTCAEGLILYCDTADDFYLFNPLTKQTEILNFCAHTYPANSTSSEVFYALGYAYNEDDYKVFRISTFNNPAVSTLVMVYSRNRGEWHRTTELHSCDAITQARVNVCGRVHWITSTAAYEYCVTALDIENETYSTISLNHIPTTNCVRQLFSLDSNTLAICCSFLREDSIHTVWVLQDYNDNSSWFNIEVSLAGIINQFGYYTLQPMSLIFPERSKLLLRVDPVGVFLIYDINEKTFDEVGHEQVGTGHMSFYRFIPTLRSSLL